MNCQELVECITDYVEGHLPAGETQRLEDHLAECPHCRMYLEQMRAVIRTAGKLQEEDISSEAKQKLLDIFQNWKQGA